MADNAQTKRRAKLIQLLRLARFAGTPDETTADEIEQLYEPRRRRKPPASKS